MFTANNHSQWKVGWRPVNPEVQAQVRRIAACWGINAINSVAQVDAWEQGSNNFSIIGPQGRFLLRKNILASPPQLDASVFVLSYLYSQGVPVPQILPTTSGGSLAEQDGHFWMLFDFIEGDYFRGTIDELGQATRIVASMHEALARCPSFDQIQSADVAIGPLHLDYALIAGKDDAYVATLAAEKDFIDGLMGGVRDRLANLSTLRQQTIHADLHPQNFLSQDGEIKTLIDFGNVAFGTLGSDVGMACHRLVRQYIVYHELPWQDQLPSIIASFLEVYRSVNKLEDEEVRFLPWFMRELFARKVATGFYLYTSGRRTPELALSQYKRLVGMLPEVEAIEQAMVSI